MTEHDPENACPGLDPGWKPVFRKDHAPLKNDAGLAAVEDGTTPLRRRDLLALIGTLAGSTAMYHAITSLGFASDSAYQGPIQLSGDAKGASVMILGAGLAGMTAALELRKAGSKVAVLEFNQRPGGRNWTLRGGDTYVELGGQKQVCEFDDGLYLNPGPWRLRIITARCSTTASASMSRSSLSSSSITMPCCMPPARSAASRSVFAPSRPISRDRCPSCSPRPPRRAGSMKKSRHKTRRCCCRRSNRGARSTAIMPTRPT